MTCGVRGANKNVFSLSNPMSDSGVFPAPSTEKFYAPTDRSDIEAQAQIDQPDKDVPCASPDASCDESKSDGTCSDDSKTDGTCSEESKSDGTVSTDKLQRRQTHSAEPVGSMFTDIFGGRKSSETSSETPMPMPMPAVSKFALSQTMARTRILDSMGRRNSVENKGRKNIDLSKMKAEIVYENYWTESSLGLLEDWMIKSENEAARHTEAAVRSRRMNVRVALPSIVLGAAATGLAFFSVGDDCSSGDDTGPTAVSIALAVLTSAFSVVGGMSSLFSLSERQSQHIAAASGFSNLAKKIQVCIFLPMELRSQCEVVLIDVSSEYTNLISTSPLIYNGY